MAPQGHPPAPRLHYAWIIALAGMVTVLAALGLGRFALGMLLPSMGAALELSYSEMGYVSTANFVGYLAAVVMSGYGVRRFGARHMIFAGLLAVGGSMLLVSQADGFVSVLLAYVLTGIGSGSANVPIMGLAAHWFRPSHRGRAAGLIVIGSGFAIMLSGTLIPALNALRGAEGWRLSWLVLGLLSLAIALLGYSLLRDSPAEMGLEPVGRALPLPGQRQGPDHAHRFGLLAHLGSIYFLFGCTYVIYATFIVTTLVQERGMGEATAGNFWFWIGFLSLFSGPVFGTQIGRAHV
jgi:sugar phosphate permease